MSDLKDIIKPGTEVYIPVQLYEFTMHLDGQCTYALNSRFFPEIISKAEENRDFYTLRKLISRANTQDLLDELRERFPDVDISSVINESTIKMMEDNMKKWEDSKKKTEEESDDSDDSEPPMSMIYEPNKDTRFHGGLYMCPNCKEPYKITDLKTLVKKIHCIQCEKPLKNPIKFEANEMLKIEGNPEDNGYYICPNCREKYSMSYIQSVRPIYKEFNCTNCEILLKNPIFKTEEESNDSNTDNSEVKEMVYIGDNGGESYYKCPICDMEYVSWSIPAAVGTTFRCTRCTALLKSPYKIKIT